MTATIILLIIIAILTSLAQHMKDINTQLAEYDDCLKVLAAAEQRNTSNKETKSNQKDDRFL